MEENGWCIALYVRDSANCRILQMILRYYLFRNGRPYLTACKVNRFNFWWKKYKSKDKAKTVLQKILRECLSVRGGFIFRSDDLNNEDCFMWKNSVENKVYLETNRENYKKILSAQLGIVWKD